MRFPLSRRNALLAIERDATLAEPHASLGYVKLYFDWDWAGAEAEFQQAIALDPANSRRYSDRAAAHIRNSARGRSVVVSDTLSPP